MHDPDSAQAADRGRGRASRHPNDLRARSAQGKGDRLAGELLGTAAADWAVLGSEGTGTLDIRWTLRTDDGAAILVQYHDRLDASQGLQFP